MNNFGLDQLLKNLLNSVNLCNVVTVFSVTERSGIGICYNYLLYFYC